MAFSLRKRALVGLTLMLFLGGCKSLNLGRRSEEIYYQESLVWNTVSYEISNQAEEYLKAVEDLYLHENPKFKGMKRLPDSTKVAIRMKADKMGTRDRRISGKEGKALYSWVVNEYERTLSLPRFEMEFEEQ